MADFTANSFSELTSLITKHQKQHERNVKAATRKAARAGKAIVKKAVPVAFGELRESVHTESANIVVDAPHAAAVNNGSRPHWVPLEALIEWVKLRGTQGLLSERQQSRLPGSSTRDHATNVAFQLWTKEQNGALGVDAAEELAKAIQLSIAAKGTKPHHFIEASLPEILALLVQEMSEAMKSPEAEVVAPGADGKTGPGTTKSSGRYRKNSGMFRGKRTEFDQHGREFVRLNSGKIHYLTG